MITLRRFLGVLSLAPAVPAIAKLPTPEPTPPKGFWCAKKERKLAWLVLDQDTQEVVPVMLTDDEMKVINRWET